MTRLSEATTFNKPRKTRTSRRSGWLKSSIVAGSIAATLAGAQGIAWLESARQAETNASASEVTIAAAPTSATTPLSPAATSVYVAAASTPASISIQALLPTVTPVAAAPVAVAQGAAVTPTDTPVATLTPTATPTLAPTATPTVAPTAAQVQPVTRSRSSQ